MKPWYTSKTIWVNLVALIGSILVAYGFEPSRWAEIAAGTLAVVNVVLRLVTGEPIGAPEKEGE
jgi:hypothetical protein